VLCPGAQGDGFQRPVHPPQPDMAPMVAGVWFARRYLKGGAIPPDVNAMSQQRNFYADIAGIASGLLVVLPLASFIFGVIYENTYYGQFGIRPLDFANYFFFASSPLKAMIPALWALLMTFVAVGGVYTFVVRPPQAGLTNYFHALAPPLLMFWGAYYQVVDSAESAAMELRPVAIELHAPAAKIREYLEIGRIGSYSFLCDPSNGQTTTLSDGQIARRLTDPTRQPRACRRESGDQSPGT
jgi:hypothetical protein